MTGKYYVPGVCNLNDSEVNYRKKGGTVFAVMTVMLLLAMVYFRVNPAFGLFVSIPAFMAAEQLLQVRNRFCVTYAQKGRYSNGSEFRVFATVDNVKDKLLDKTKARKINLQCFAIAAISGVISMLVLAIR